MGNIFVYTVIEEWVEWTTTSTPYRKYNTKWGNQGLDNNSRENVSRLVTMGQKVATTRWDVVRGHGIRNSAQMDTNQSQRRVPFASRAILKPFETGKQQYMRQTCRKQRELLKPMFWANGRE